MFSGPARAGFVGRKGKGKQKKGGDCDQFSPPSRRNSITNVSELPSKASDWERSREDSFGRKLVSPKVFFYRLVMCFGARGCD